MSEHPGAPAFFLAHATPMLAIAEPYPYIDALRGISQRFVRPKAVVVVSSYGISGEKVEISASDPQEIHHDFTGFPEELYQLGYSCPGSRELSVRVAALLADSGFTVELNTSHRLDHGVWMPLRFILPEGKTPVIQVMLPEKLGPRYALKLGKALAPLRGEGVWIIGSGGAVHNLSRLVWYLRDAPAPSWATEFEGWVKQQLAAKDVEALVEFQAEGPHAELAQPDPRHFYPLLVTVGSAWSGDQAVPIFEGIQYQSVSLLSFALTGARAS